MYMTVGDAVTSIARATTHIRKPSLAYSPLSTVETHQGSVGQAAEIERSIGIACMCTYARTPKRSIESARVL